jgi:peptidase E
MNKYILHGGATTVDNDSNNRFFQQLAHEIPENGNVLLVYFATRETDISPRANFDEQKIQQAASKTFTATIATKENFIAEVEAADVIYFRGGSTDKLLKTLKVYSDLKSALLNKQKTIAGSSAGAYALATYYSSHYDDVVSMGLGIVPVRVVTHYESTKMPPMPGAVMALTNMPSALPLILLRETEWCVVQP